jgi:hypothetical protein
MTGIRRDMKSGGLESVQAFALGVFPRDALQVTLDGGSFLALAFLGWLLVKLTAAQFRQNAGFLTGTLEAAQGGIEIFIFFYANTGHTNSGLLVFK